MLLKFLFTMVVMIAPVCAAVFRVDPNASGGLKDGSSWVNAFLDLQGALSRASNGDEVWVRAGVYYPDEGLGQVNGSESSSFTLNRGVRLYGGFFGNETARNQRAPGTHPTILSGDLDQDDLDPDGDHVTVRTADIRGVNARQIVTVTGSSFGGVIDGFTITGGNSLSEGAGMISQGSDQLIANCRFEGNRARAGGALFLANWNGFVANCVFSGNESTTQGGGVYIIYDSTLTNCLFIANIARTRGGGIFADSGTVRFGGCSFLGNSAVQSGGAIFSNRARPTIENSILWNNSGGTDPAPTSKSIALGSNISIYRPYFVGSLVEGSGGSSSWVNPYLQNGGGNIDTDPLLIALPPIGQFPDFPDALRPGPGSPAINAGNNSRLVPDTADLDRDGNTGEPQPIDLLGSPRVVNGRVDMGAFEAAPGPEIVAPPPPLVLSPNATDIPDVDLSAAFDASAVAFVIISVSNEELVDLTLDPSSGLLGISLRADAIGATRVLVRAANGSGGASYLYFEIEAFPDVLYVDADAAGSNSGLSWADAFLNLQDALVLGGSRHEIWVAEGVYHPDSGGGMTAGNSSASFVLPSGVELLGGFSGVETDPAQRDPERRSILSGDIDRNDLNGDANSIAERVDDVIGTNSKLVLKVDAAPAGTRIEQLVVTAGKYVSPSSLSGGVWFSASEVVVARCDFFGNRGLNGGGIHVAGASKLAISECRFGGNAASKGGALWIDGGGVSVGDSIFEGNSAVSEGGGVFAQANSMLDVLRCQFSGNSSNKGGAIRTDATELNLSQCDFIGNQGTGSSPRGGAVSVNSGSAEARHCFFQDNHCPVTFGYGGAIYLSGASTRIELVSSRFWQNSAYDGGALYLDNGSDAALFSCRLAGNSANSDGGALYLDGGDASVAGCEFAGNFAASDGGAFYNDGATPEINGCSLVGNRAGLVGGAIYNDTSNTAQPAAPLLVNSIIWNNQSYGATDTARASVGDSSSSNHYSRFAHCLVANSGGSAAWNPDLGVDEGGNLDADPLFLISKDPSAAPTIFNDLRVETASPVIDVGDTARLPADVADLDGDSDVLESLPFDLAGLPRVASSVVDIGAYEDQAGPQLVQAAPRVRLEPLSGVHPSLFDLSGFFDASAVSFGIDVVVPNHVLTASVDPITGMVRVEVLPNVFGPVTLVVSATDSAGATSHHAIHVDVFPSVVHVDVDASGLGTGLTWSDAFTDLQSALSIAVIEGLPFEIWVAEGVYFPDRGPGQTGDDPASVFSLIPNCHVYGGFGGGEVSKELRNPEVNLTILSGDLAGDDVDASGKQIVERPSDQRGVNANHILECVSQLDGIVLDGFTITGAAQGAFLVTEATLDVNSCRFQGNKAVGGGAARITDSEVVFEGCDFIANHAISSQSSTSVAGGAIYARNSVTVLDSCRFESNQAGGGGSAGGDGGAIFAFGGGQLELVGTVFLSNLSHDDGGAVNCAGVPCVVEMCRFGNNAMATESFGHGGALYLNGAPALIRNTDFFGNRCTSSGGALSFQGNFLLRCINSHFRGNAAGYEGGALSMGGFAVRRFVNCGFSGNFATQRGGAVNCGTRDLIFTHCTFAGNRSLREGGAIYYPFIHPSEAPSFVASIFWNNEASGSTKSPKSTISSQANSQVNTTFTNCLVMSSGGSTAWDTKLGIDGGGNTDADPEFLIGLTPALAPTAVGDYRLSVGSPAIDAGSSGNLPADDADLDNDSDLLEPLPLDGSGNPRVNGTAPDLGAFEAGSGPSLVNPLSRLDLDPDSGNQADLFSLADAFDGSATGFSLATLQPTGGLGVSVDGTTGLVGLSVPPGTVGHFVAVFEVTNNAGQGSLYAVEIDIFPDVLFVDDSASGSGSGLSWEDAIPHLQDALALGGEGYSIWVAEGVYLPDLGAGRVDDDPDVPFFLPDGVALYGGFAGDEVTLEARDLEDHLSILSGDLALDDLNTDGNRIAESDDDLVGTNARTVVVASGVSSGTVFDGFQITGGSGGNFGRGGGLSCFGGNPTIRHCRFSGNDAGHGGALALIDTAMLLIEETEFYRNSSYTNGGAVYVENSAVEFRSCRFVGNRSVWGGGLSALNSDLNCEASSFHANVSERGGAVYLVDGNATLSNSIFHGNLAGSGGAIENYAKIFDATHCTFTENTAREYSGAVANDDPSGGDYPANYTNCIIWNNRARHRGDQPGASSGTYSSFQSNAIFTSCLIANSGGSGAWNSEIGVDGGSNIDLDPLFLASGTPNVPLVDPSAFRLKTGSPAIDAAATSPPGGDFDEIVRPQGPASDLGAFEARPAGPAILAAPASVRLMPNSGPHPAIEDFSGVFDDGTQSYEIDMVIPDNLLDVAIDSTTGMLDVSVLPDAFGRAQISVAGLNDGSGRSLVTLVIDVVPEVIYVDPAAPGNGSGLRWDDAFPTPQHALNQLVDGYEVWVAEGVYYPYDGPGVLDTGKDANFRLRSGVEVYGGFGGSETDRSQRDSQKFPTVLKGYEPGPATILTYQVVTSIGTDSSAVLDGFTITRGLGGTASGGINVRHGGGIFIEDASPSINDCRLLDNHSSWGSGGGVAIRGTSAPTFRRCRFLACTSFHDFGGAVGIKGASAPSFISCVFQGNQAYSGGALALVSPSTASVINCSFSGNKSRIVGGAIRNESVLALSNSIVWNNLSGSDSAPTTSSPASSLFTAATASSSISHCLVANSGGSASWNGVLGSDLGVNLDADPAFLIPADPSSAPNAIGDLQLLFGTAALDLGDNSLVTESLDLLGAPRITNGTVDLGAFEGQNDQLDIDGDGLSDAFELASTSPPSRTALNPGEDDDRDGLSNDLEFFFRLDPRVSDAEKGSAMSMIKSGGSSYLSLQYRSNLWARPFLETQVERSGDLGGLDDWSGGETTVIVRDTIGAGLEVITERSNEAIGSQVSEFLRVSTRLRPK